MVEIKIASITGNTAKLISKAQDDAGLLVIKDCSKSPDQKVLDVYIDIEEWRGDLVKEWMENQDRLKNAP
ncbi:MAG: hypothetical protein E6L03_09460 [Thaumarchaeota archaeon]|nr:MAG: hypothetical protein E6L03_09460 [Nitrososphaerota archaeon]